jgi:hypothetical protein
LDGTSAGRAHVAPGINILVSVGVLLLMLTGLLLILKVWFLVISRLLEGKVLRAGVWLCLGIMLLNLFIGDGEDFT